jgi:hypothetical protein
LADAIVLVPDTNAAACRALIDQRSIRYFVSVAGYRWSGPRVGQQWANTAYGWEAPLVYVLAAQVFDAKNGAVVCDASDVEQATSSVGFLWLYLPFPVFSVVDESAYWQRRAWNIGNKLRSCFLPRAASDSNR